MSNLYLTKIITQTLKEEKTEKKIKKSSKSIINYTLLYTHKNADIFSIKHMFLLSYFGFLRSFESLLHNLSAKGNVKTLSIQMPPQRLKLRASISR